MKTGYSLLLGEYIDATALEYRDCEPFQVVCPACYEPLFKVQRTADEGAVNYLSHYRKDAAYGGDCELRAVSRSAAELASRNSESREQRLRFFLQVLRKELEKDPRMKYGRSLEHSHRMLRKSKALEFFRDRHIEAARATGGLTDPMIFAEAADGYVRDVEQYGSFPNTGFSLATQVRIAGDVFRHLATPSGRSNYDALFHHAILILLWRLGNPAEDATAEDRHVMQTIGGFLRRLCTGGKRDGFLALQEMTQRPIAPPHVEQPTSYVVKIASEISHEMIGTLLQIPYFDLLRDRAENRAGAGQNA